MRVLRIATVGVVVAQLLMLAGCRSREATIAVVPRTTATLLWEPMHVGVVEEARATGLHVYWNAPADEGDTDGQVALVGAVRRKSRGIIFAPDETLASRSVVLAAVNSHVPVVVVDDELGPPPGPLLSYVSSDETVGPEMAAARLAKILNGRGSIAIMGISPRLETGLTRERSFEQAIARIAPGITVVARHFGDALIAHQQQIAQEYLNRPGGLDAIVALSGPSTRGAYYAKLAMAANKAIGVKKAGAKAPAALIGFDQDMLLPIETGEVDAVIAQDTRTIGQMAMKNLAAELRGDAVAPRTVVAPLLVTRETLRSDAAMRLWAFSQPVWSGQ